MKEGADGLPAAHPLSLRQKLEEKREFPPDKAGKKLWCGGNARTGNTSIEESGKKEQMEYKRKITERNRE